MSNFLPSKLIAALKKDFQIDEEEFIRTHQQQEQITSIRVNPAKPIRKFEKHPPVPWCSTGYYLNERPTFTLDPLFQAGTYYVQEASSMFIDHIIRFLDLHKEATLTLDLCAAPGGKSTLLNSALHEDSLLVSNEIIKSRVNILADNLTKWGNYNTVVTNNDPMSFNRLPGFFDLMLVDAPCSGSGMFRKDAQSLSEWSEEAVNLCSQRQQRILSDSLSTLKEEGTLIYSTCSYSMEENEQIADWLAANHDMQSIPIAIDPTWQIEETRSPVHQCHGYRFYPHKVQGEGFYIACFRKKKSQGTFNKKKVKIDKSQLDKTILKDWVKMEKEFTTLSFKEDTLIIPSQHALNIVALQNVLYLKKVGTNLGRLAKKELIPHHELALSTAISDHVPRIELSLDNAQQYLRKAEMQLTTNIKGWALASYSQYALGWIKILPHRINNYYPKEWRIVNL